MAFESYSAACTRLAKEVSASLTTAEIDDLRTICAGVGLRSFVDWYDSQRAEVVKFVLATPAQRDKRKSWNQDRQYALLLRLGALVYLHGAQSFAEALCEIDLLALRGPSNREFAHQAGSLYLALKCSPFCWWPLHGDSPFE